MSLRDWPRPVRRLIGYAIAALALCVSFGPLAVFLLSGDGLQWLNASGQIFVAYTACIAGATSAIASGFIRWRMRDRIPRNLTVDLVLGTLIGLFVGLCLIPFTLGMSLVFAPPCGVMGAVFARFAVPRT